MDSGYYSACAGLVAQMQALDLAANNLANTSTVGYRGRSATFHSVLVRSGMQLAGAQPEHEFGVLDSPSVDLAQGNLETTGSPLDLAIEGPGFFAVQTKDGVRYTRDGSFRLSSSGQLLTSSGDAVLGQDGPIQLANGPVVISPDGTVSVGGALAGKLRVVEFPPAALTSAGNAYYSVPQAAAEAATQSTVQQGKLESSNVNPVAGAVGLIALQRHAEMLQRALSTFHSEFNRLAAEELPKV